VLGLPDREWGESVTAVIIPADPGNPPDLTCLRSQVRRALSAYAAPSRVVVVPQFPILPSGKPDRAALRERVLREVAGRDATP
jgi:o-succinylbenzoate---CoA ligase